MRSRRSSSDALLARQKNDGTRVSYDGAFSKCKKSCKSSKRIFRLFLSKSIFASKVYPQALHQSPRCVCTNPPFPPLPSTSPQNANAMLKASHKKNRNSILPGCIHHSYCQNAEKYMYYRTNTHASVSVIGGGCKTCCGEEPPWLFGVCGLIVSVDSLPFSAVGALGGTTSSISMPRPASSS